MVTRSVPVADPLPVKAGLRCRGMDPLSGGA